MNVLAVVIMTLKTFDIWSKAGYKIKKGSKAIWVDEMPMFSEEQVSYSPPRDFGNHWKGCTPKGTSSYYDELDDAYSYGDYY